MIEKIPFVNDQEISQKVKKPDSCIRQYFDGYYYLEYDSSLYEEFKASYKLLQEWKNKYPFIYEECFNAAWKQAVNQGNHFGEFYFAIHLFENYNYYSLIEKYEIQPNFGKEAKHPIKFDIFSKIVGYEDADYFSREHKKEIGAKGLEIKSAQCPDLLVYDTKNLNDSFFVEVKHISKTSKDNLKESQDNYFPVVKERSQKPIYLAIVVGV